MKRPYLLSYMAIFSNLQRYDMHIQSENTVNFYQQTGTFTFKAKVLPFKAC